MAHFNSLALPNTVDGFQFCKKRRRLHFEYYVCDALTCVFPSLSESFLHCSGSLCTLVAFQLRNREMYPKGIHFACHSLKGELWGAILLQALPTEESELAKLILGSAYLILVLSYIS